ncbi:MAG TPA: hypothetical protein VFN10_07925 [Thermoanaerobaculia bacterium]|nr:hypothetical protein [Thermoanaerobaculia bacterium]
MSFAKGHRAGYLLVQRPDIVVATYDRSEFAIENRGLLDELRRALPFIEPASYRGLSRAPVDAEQLTSLRTACNGAAPEGEIGDDDVIETLELASFLRGLMPYPDTLEVIYVESGEVTTTHETLGYDVGYWTGDHFSLIADVAVTPLWHPPSPDAFADVAEHLLALNEQVLFPDYAEASRYRSFYRAQDWAETEFDEDQFRIVRVALPA